MKRFLLTLLTVALVAALAVFVVAPAAVRQRRLWENGKAVAGYLDCVNGLSAPDCEAMLAQAQEHNRALDSAPWADPYAPEAGPADEGGSYAALLNPAGNGVMAVLDMPKLGVSLPVYHGGESAIPGRVEQAPLSWLPSGDTEGPCVLRAGHERFFDPFADLDRLMVGDCFFLRVLQETATYEVFQVAMLSPGALAGLEGIEYGDECALVAQTAAGDRRVVRGRRVPRQSVKPTDDSRPLPGGVPELIFAAPIAAAGLALLAIVEVFRRAVQRHRRRRTKL